MARGKILLMEIRRRQPPGMFLKPVVNNGKVPISTGEFTGFLVAINQSNAKVIYFLSKNSPVMTTESPPPHHFNLGNPTGRVQTSRSLGEDSPLLDIHHLCHLTCSFCEQKNRTPKEPGRKSMKYPPVTNIAMENPPGSW